jgi:hypothetical protein
MLAGHEISAVFDKNTQIMHVMCMPTKTISLRMEAYKRLLRAKRSSRESFSDVVMRARWDDEAVTASEYVRLVRERGPAYTPDELDRVEQVKAADTAPSDKWQTD